MWRSGTHRDTGEVDLPITQRHIRKISVIFSVNFVPPRLGLFSRSHPVISISFTFGFFPAPGRGVRDRSRRHPQLGQDDPLQNQPCGDEKQDGEPVRHNSSYLLDAP